MMKQLKEEVFTPRLKKIGAILGMAFLLVCGMTSMNAVQAQTQSTFTVQGANQGGANSLARNYSQGISEAGIDLSGISATVQEAMVYAKGNYDDVYTGNSGYAGIEKNIASTYYETFTNFLYNGSKSGVEVSSGVIAGYAAGLRLIENENYGATYKNFLLSLVRETVEDLQ